MGMLIRISLNMYVILGKKNNSIIFIFIIHERITSFHLFVFFNFFFEREWERVEEERERMVSRLHAPHDI